MFISSVLVNIARGIQFEVDIILMHIRGFFKLKIRVDDFKISFYETRNFGKQDSKLHITFKW